MVEKGKHSTKMVNGLTFNMKPPKTPQEIREKKKQIAEKLKARALARKTKKQFSRSKLVEEADRIFSIYIR